jgi:hypothetical protein
MPIIAPNTRLYRYKAIYRHIEVYVKSAIDAGWISRGSSGGCVGLVVD